jgi:hypothetical protein
MAKLTKRLRDGKSPKKVASDWDEQASNKHNKTYLDKRLLARFRDHYMTYEPAPLDAPVTLFVSREWRHVNLKSVRQMSGTNLSIHEIDGQHTTLFSKDHIQDLGSALNLALKRISNL